VNGLARLLLLEHKLRAQRDATLADVVDARGAPAAPTRGGGGGGGYHGRRGRRRADGEAELMAALRRDAELRERMVKVATDPTRDARVSHFERERHHTTQTRQK